MKRIEDRVEAVRSRQQKQWLWHTASIGMVVGGAMGCVLGAVLLLGSESLSLSWIAASLVAGPIVGLIFGIAVPRGSHQAAVAIDHEYGLKDRIATAFNFMNLKSEQTALHELQVDDAHHHADQVDPVRVAPYHAPRSWGWGLSLSAVALLIAVFAAPQEEVSAAVVHDEVVANQADRMAEGLEELEQFNQDGNDPELEELLKEMAEKIEELQQPGVDPKEALAKLSEMEAMLQAKQEQLADPSTEAALQEIGEALTLAEPFQAAGQAMSQGEMEKAAEELAKLEMPELDRKTERAVTEKLDKAAENSSQGAQRRLKEAVGKLSTGLTKGDRSRFKDGMQGLAGECKKQGRRKKLADLLRKQCNCLSECKSECEGACRKNSNSKGKGGKGWGLGASGNEPGDKTAKLKSGPQMQITGVESDGGDVDVETMKSEEQQQDAARRYQKKVDKYEQISESVLDSEPIPLGHRQTIRRYFKLIRPQGAETDAVNDAIREK